MPSVLSAAAALIEQQEADIDKTNGALAKEGFSDLPTMITKYKQVMVDTNEISIERDTELEEARTELAALRKECGRLIDLAGDWKEAADKYHAELVALREAGRWIPVTERLPEPHKRVLIYFNRKSFGRRIMLGHYGYCGPNQAGWKDEQGRIRGVTHWMPLPAAPEKEGE